MMANSILAFSASDPDPFDFAYWAKERYNNTIRFTNNITWPVLLDKVPNPTPAYHGENYTSYVPPINDSTNKSAFDKIIENPTTKYLFIFFVILIVGLGFYIYYKYSHGGDTITFDKDFGV
jgi:hypothetical protein